MNGMEIFDLPVAMDAEQALIGQLLLANNAVDQVADQLRSEHFSHPAHAKLYDHIVRVVQGGGTASATLLHPYFEADDAFTPVGGAKKYLTSLVAEAPMMNDVRDYAATIIDRHRRRALMQAAHQIIVDARTPDIDRPADVIIEEAEAQLFALADKTIGGAVAVSAADLYAKTLTFIDRKQSGKIVGVPTGIAALEDHIGQLPPGEMTILAGRPGMGKTAMALTIAVNAAQAGTGVLFQSLEMGDAQLMQRIIARETGIPTGLQNRAGAMRAEGFQKLVAGAAAIQKLPLWVDESGTITAAQIRARVRRMKRLHPEIGLLVVDYLGLVRPGDARAQRVHQLGEVSKMMKATAKDLHIHVLLLAQLSRAVEGREDKRPHLSDLRDSGEIEEDADMILFPYRAEYYLKEQDPTRKPGESDEKFNDRYAAWQSMMEDAAGKAEIIVAKFRQGNPGTVRCGFNGGRQYFHDLNV